MKLEVFNESKLKEQVIRLKLGYANELVYVDGRVRPPLHEDVIYLVCVDKNGNVLKDGILASIDPTYGLDKYRDIKKYGWPKEE